MVDFSIPLFRRTERAMLLAGSPLIRARTV